ncbi:2TM domain-containing protein, partial [Klebsiella pneumoniae]|uniref:2TM domain-containing protein n=1 Tax=Klebsiella pneumoniae TaxID=573 RepID=UPI0039C4DE7F
MLLVKPQVSSEESEDEAAAYKKAQRRVREMKKFYSSLITFSIIIPFLFFVNLFTSKGEYWFWYPALAWGMV